MTFPVVGMMTIPKQHTRPHSHDFQLQWDGVQDQKIIHDLPQYVLYHLLWMLHLILSTVKDTRSC